MSLSDLGLAMGDTVRYRRRTAKRWTEARVTGLNKDGSVSLYDGRHHRAIPTDCIEVPTTGPRGGQVWVPLTQGEP